MATLSLASVLAEPARQWPDKTAVIESERRRSYADLWRAARATAAALQELGVEAGTRVALLAPNVVEFVEGYYGILAAGGIVVPIPTLLNAEEAAYLVADSGAQLVLHHASFAELGSKAAAQAGIPAHSLEGLGEGHEPIDRIVGRDSEDVALIFYTSGTTGRPKGALLTHLNLVMNATTNAYDGNQIDRDAVVMASLPLFHTFGQTAAMNSTFRLGATLLLQPRFDAAAAIELMVRERATRFLGVPTMYIHLLQAAERADQLPRLAECVSGGASLPVAVLERFEEVFGTRIYEGYGLSETSPTATVNQRVFGTRPGTVGHAAWGVEVAIADETVPDAIVLRGPEELGEVVVRGHNVFKGYLDRPDATAAALVDGWFRTGDIGRIDQDGFLSIVDRMKDLIIRGGFNVYPREVEEVLARHPDIAQVAVIGIPDEERGEEVCAVVVPRAGREIVPAELVAWSRERLAHHKYPRLVQVVAELPLGPSNKVLKRELRRRYGS